MSIRSFFVCVFFVCIIACAVVPISVAQEKAADSFSTSITKYQEVSQKIINAARAENDSYLKLQELCDDIGHRISGSPQLAQAVEWAQKSMKADGQENVRAERVWSPSGCEETNGVE